MKLLALGTLFIGLSAFASQPACDGKILEVVTYQETDTTIVAKFMKQLREEFALEVSKITIPTIVNLSHDLRMAENDFYKFGINGALVGKLRTKLRNSPKRPTLELDSKKEDECYFDLHQKMNRLASEQGIQDKFVEIKAVYRNSSLKSQPNKIILFWSPTRTASGI